MRCRTNRARLLVFWIDEGGIELECDPIQFQPWASDDPGKALAGSACSGKSGWKARWSLGGSLLGLAAVADVILCSTGAGPTPAALSVAAVLEAEWGTERIEQVLHGSAEVPIGRFCTYCTCLKPSHHTTLTLITHPHIHHPPPTSNDTTSANKQDIPQQCPGGHVHQATAGGGRGPDKILRGHHNPQQRHHRPGNKLARRRGHQD